MLRCSASHESQCLVLGYATHRPVFSPCSGSCRNLSVMAGVFSRTPSIRLGASRRAQRACIETLRLGEKLFGGREGFRDVVTP